MRKRLFKNDPTPTIWWYTAWTRTKARFIRTYLGNIWIGLSNLLAVCALGSVYRYIFNVSNFKYYFGYLGIGITIWGFIAGSILASSSIFQTSKIKSLNSEFTPSYFFLEEVFFQLYCFLQSSLPVIIVLLIIGVVNPLTIFTSIIPAINLFFVTFIVSGLIALIGAKYKDIAQLIPVILQLIFLASPIMFYKEAMGRAYIISEYNIIYRSLDSVRTALLDGQIFVLKELLLLPILIIISYYVYMYILKLRNKIMLWY